MWCQCTAVVFISFSHCPSCHLSGSDHFPAPVWKFNSPGAFWSSCHTQGLNLVIRLHTPSFGQKSNMAWGKSWKVFSSLSGAWLFSQREVRGRGSFLETWALSQRERVKGSASLLQSTVCLTLTLSYYHALWIPTVSPLERQHLVFSASVLSQYLIIGTRGRMLGEQIHNWNSQSSCGAFKKFRCSDYTWEIWFNRFFCFIESLNLQQSWKPVSCMFKFS